MRIALLLVPVASAFLVAAFLCGPVGPGGCGPAAPPASGTGATSAPQDTKVSGNQPASPGKSDAGTGATR